MRGCGRGLHLTPPPVKGGAAGRQTGRDRGNGFECNVDGLERRFIVLLSKIPRPHSSPQPLPFNRPHNFPTRSLQVFSLVYSLSEGAGQHPESRSPGPPPSQPLDRDTAWPTPVHRIVFFCRLTGWCFLASRMWGLMAFTIEL